MLLVPRDKYEIYKLKNLLKREFKINDSKVVERFLSIEIYGYIFTKNLYLSQEMYIKKLIE